jgi:uncharacterized membrane protein
VKLTLHAKIVFVVGLIVSVLLVLMPTVMPLSGEPGSDSVIALGRFHIIVLHFPICLLLVTPLLELLGCVRPMYYFKEAVQSVLWLAIVFAIGACVLGFLLATGEGDAGKLVEDHMWGGILTTILMFVALFIYELNLGRQRTGLYLTYLLILVASIVSLTVGSHHGASLVHGDDYLYEKAPVFVKNMIGLDTISDVTLTFDSPAYAGLIEPIFETHCYSCHSELKEKGQYRMDTFESMLAGGRSGHAGVVPGDVSASELFNRITLPLADDAVMPPKEQTPLTADEVALIEWWIESGASQDQSIDALSYELYPDHIDAILVAQIGAESLQMEPLDEAVFSLVANQVKSEFGVDLIRYSQDLEDGVYLVTRNAKARVSADTFEDLERVGAYVRSINLWRCDLQSGAFLELVHFPFLYELHLSESNVTDADLVVLTDLRKLKTLNLFGTEVGDDSIDTLSKLRSLRALHLNSTRFSDAGVAKLQAALPRCEIYYTFESQTPSAEETEAAGVAVVLD